MGSPGLGVFMGGVWTGLESMKTMTYKYVINPLLGIIPQSMFNQLHL